MEIKEMGNNEIGKSLQIGRYSVTVQKVKPFKDWIDDYNDFLAFNKSDKRKLFLRWKWGFMTNEINEALEMTRRTMLERYRALLDSPEEDTKKMAEYIVNFEDYCCKVMREIGMMGNKTEVQEVIDGILEEAI